MRWSWNGRRWSSTPRLVPVLETTNEYVAHGDAVLCYRLDELAEGRSTIFGCERAYESDRGDYFVETEFTRYGDSLLSVLHEYTSDEVRRLTYLSTAPWSWGSDAILDEDIETARQRVRVVEDLQRRLNESMPGRGLSVTAVSVGPARLMPYTVVPAGNRHVEIQDAVLWRHSVITHVELANFKSWEHTGPIDFAPVTAFFGGNSSGKTSLLQSLLLLKQTTDSADRGRVFDLGGTASLVSLGTFQDIVFDHDSERSVNIEISWREDQAFTIRDPAQGKSSIVTSSSDLKLSVEVFSQRSTPVVRTVTYGVGDLNFWMQRKRDDKNEYDLGSNSYKFRRVTGRAWPLPQPAKFYGFPDQVRAYYQNASFLSDLELQFEGLCGRIHYLGPLRQDPERQYVWSGGRPVDVGRRGELAVDALISSQTDGPVNSRGFVKTSRGIRRTPRISVEQHVAEWLKQLGLIHEFSVKAVDDRKTLYRVHVQQTRHSAPVLLTDVGFGVSQVLPVLVLLAYVPEGSTVLLEQPEIHLHPSVQSGLGDILIEAALMRKVQVVVESHSEHLLMRLQRRIAEKNLASGIVVSPDDFGLYFCETREGRSRLERLKVDRFGAISNWPQDFFGDPFAEAATTAKAARSRAALERST